MIPALACKGSVPDNARAQRVYALLADEEGAVVRYRGSEVECAGCLRITVRSEEENAVASMKLSGLKRTCNLAAISLPQ